MEFQTTLSKEEKIQIMHSEKLTLNLKEFTVIAGKYERGYSDDENIKYTSELMTLDAAIEKANEYMTYPLCFIEYRGSRLKVY